MHAVSSARIESGCAESFAGGARVRARGGV